MSVRSGACYGRVSCDLNRASRLSGGLSPESANTPSRRWRCRSRVDLRSGKCSGIKVSTSNGACTSYTSGITRAGGGVGCKSVIDVVVADVVELSNADGRGRGCGARCGVRTSFLQVKFIQVQGSVVRSRIPQVVAHGGGAEIGNQVVVQILEVMAEPAPC
jgi:hypothetical protein